MFDKFLSKVGIGAAKVDTILKNPALMRGEFLTGEIHMTGGKIAQEVKQVYLELYTNYHYEMANGEMSITSFVLHRLNIAESFTLEAGEEAVWDFEIEVPLTTPVTMDSPNVWLRTGLDVAWSWDPKDNDVVQILADPATEHVLGAAEALGFVHTHESGECFPMDNPFGVPFVQQFILRGSGKIGRHIEELSLLIGADGEGAEVLMEVDRRNRGFGGWVADGLDLDEHQMSFSLSHDQPFTPADLEGILQEALNH